MTATGDAVRRAVRFGVCLILAAGALAGTGCSGHRQDHPVVNQAPHVRVTGGPRDGTRAHYQTRIYGSGWDDDGVIEHYEYALDPPEAFTQAEINAPEQSPSIRVARIPAGFQGQPDTLRISKVDSSRTVAFDYLATRHLGFTTWTYAPTSWITSPRLDQKFLNTGGKLVVQWGGWTRTRRTGPSRARWGTCTSSSTCAP